MFLLPPLTPIQCIHKRVTKEVLLNVSYIMSLFYSKPSCGFSSCPEEKTESLHWFIRCCMTCIPALAPSLRLMPHFPLLCPSLTLFQPYLVHCHSCETPGTLLPQNFYICCSFSLKLSFPGIFIVYSLRFLSSINFSV